MEDKKEKSEGFSVVNAVIQVAAISSYQYYGLEWPTYFVMGMIVVLGTIQTLAAALVLSSENKATENLKSSPSQIIVGLIYCASAYNIYLMGFEVFSGFAFAHAILYTLMVFLKGK
jgi:hypothetical protein